MCSSKWMYDSEFWLKFLYDLAFLCAFLWASEFVYESPYGSASLKVFVCWWASVFSFLYDLASLSASAYEFLSA